MRAHFAFKADSSTQMSFNEVHIDMISLGYLYKCTEYLAVLNYVYGTLG